VLTGLDELPLSVNVWRCFLQLVGGLGIIVLAVAILPLLGVGGAQLFKTEMTGPMKDAKLTPRIAETARGLWTVYFVGCVPASLPTAGRHELGRRLHAHVHHHEPGRLLVARCQLRLLEFAADRGRGGVLHDAGRHQRALYFVAWRQRSLRVLWRNIEARAFSVMAGAVLLISLSTYLVGGTYGYFRRAAPHRVPRGVDRPRPPATRRRTMGSGLPSRRC
jgi:trk system potassium uptake protein